MSGDDIQKHDVQKRIVELQEQIDQLEASLRQTPAPVSTAEQRALAVLRAELRIWERIYARLASTDE